MGYLFVLLRAVDGYTIVQIDANPNIINVKNYQFKTHCKDDVMISLQ